ASALVAGLAEDATINTVSGDVLVDGLIGDLNTHAVSGDVQVRGLDGNFSSDIVSGDIAVAGRVHRTDINTVTGSVVIDAEGPLYQAAVNAVSGSITLRIDDEYAARYNVHTLSGRVQVDGVARSKNFDGHAVVRSGTFAETRANTVSGDITVLRRGGVAPLAEVDVEVEWPNGGEK